MTKSAFLLVLLYFSSFAQAQEREALNKAGQAFSKTDFAKIKGKQAENKILDLLPVDKNVAGTLGGLTFYAAQGRVNTKSIKNMDFDFLGGSARADFGYDFNNNATEGFIRCQWQLEQLTISMEEK